MACSSQPLSRCGAAPQRRERARLAQPSRPTRSAVMPASLQQIAERVIVRAKEQGSVTPQQVREEVAQAGEDESFWKDVVALARSSLTFRDGCYHYDALVSDRVRRGRSQQEEVTRAVRDLIQRH